MDSVANVDLSTDESCSYQGGIAANPFFAELANDPRFAGHRGCAYCFNAHKPGHESAPAGGDGRDKVDRLLDELRSRRAMLPGLKTVWMPFAEVFYDGLSQAFDCSVGDPVWRGLTMSMQCRPDVIVTKHRDIEQLAAKAHRAQTVIKIAVVGFENFAPAELERLNRGVVPEDLSRAAVILAGWQREPVPGLDVRGYVPSFILFNPWTSLEELELNLREMARCGLSGANIERMRLGSATPLYEMARRAGLTIAAPVRLAVHPNGYFSEASYRFRDGRVAAACDGFDELKAFAFSDQAPVLAAVVDAVRRSDSPERIDWKAIAGTWRRIQDRASHQVRRAEPTAGIDIGKVLELLDRSGSAPAGLLSRPAPPPAPRGPRPSTDQRVLLGVGDACNNGCDPCVWARRLAFREQATLPLEQSVAGKVVQLAGREPTLHDNLPGLVRALRGAGAARVEIDTNGRRLLYPTYVRALDAAGLDAVTVKLFGVDAASWDAHTHAPGSFAQTLEAMATLHHLAPGIRLSAMIVPGREPGSRLAELFELARSIGLARLRVVLRLARQDLLALGALDATLASLLATDQGPEVSLSVD